MRNAPRHVPSELLLERLHAALAEAEELMKSASTVTGEKPLALLAQLETGIARAGRNLARIRAECAYRAASVARTTDRYVQRNPWRSVGIVAGVSVTVGMMAGVWIARAVLQRTDSRVTTL